MPKIYPPDISKKFWRVSKNQNGFTPPVDKQQAGFIPLILTLLAILVAIIVLVYIRVIKTGQ